MDMKPRTKIIAILLAAGRGERFGGILPKQFLPIAGKPLFRYALETLCQYAPIDEVYLVLPQNQMSFPVPKMEKLKAVLAGGEMRHHSVWNALQNIQTAPQDYILIHDGARAFLTATLLNRVIGALKFSHAVTPIIDLADALMDRHSLKTVDRTQYVALQTPQGFRSGILNGALERFFAHRESKKSIHSEFEIVRDIFPEANFATVHGEINNRKLTTVEDFSFFETLLRNRPNP